MCPYRCGVHEESAILHPSTPPCHPAPSMPIASYSMGKFKDHLAGRQAINFVFHDSKPVLTPPEKV